MRRLLILGLIFVFLMRGYKTIVGFSHDIARRGFGILGQKGFFDIFVVKFDLIKREIELKEREILN